MKYKQGFVTNSSSINYIVAIKEDKELLNIAELIKIGMKTYGHGDSEGDFVMPIDDYIKHIDEEIKITEKEIICEKEELKFYKSIVDNPMYTKIACRISDLQHEMKNIKDIKTNIQQYRRMDESYENTERHIDDPVDRATSNLKRTIDYTEDAIKSLPNDVKHIKSIKKKCEELKEDNYKTIVSYSESDGGGWFADI